MKKFFARRNLFTILGGIVVLGLIGFVEKSTGDKEVRNVLIHIKDVYGSHFIDEGDIYRLLTAGYTDSVRGKRYDEINLKKLERRVKASRFVEDVQIFKDHKGNVIVQVFQCRPVARVIQESGPQAYLNERGKVLPLSEKYTPRVVVIYGEGAGRTLDSAYQASDEGKAFLAMLNEIDSDQFLRAQVSEIYRDRSGNLRLYPQVGNEVVEFGLPEDAGEKFRKLKIYYKKIAPMKGYNRYSRVNLKFKDQIVCE